VGRKKDPGTAGLLPQGRAAVGGERSLPCRLKRTVGQQPHEISEGGITLAYMVRDPEKSILVVHVILLLTLIVPQGRTSYRAEVLSLKKREGA